MKQTITSLALIVVAALSLQAFAHGKHYKKAHDKGKAPAAKTVKGEFLGKGDGVKTCPVTGEDILNKDVKGRFFNRTVYFCCAGCLDDAKKNPPPNIKRLQPAKVAPPRTCRKSQAITTIINPRSRKGARSRIQRTPRRNSSARATAKQPAL